MSKAEFWTRLDHLNPLKWSKDTPYPTLFIPTQYDYIHEPKLQKELNTKSNYFQEKKPKPQKKKQKKNIETNNFKKTETKKHIIKRSINSNGIKSPVIKFNHKSIKSFKRSKTPKKIKRNEYNIESNNSNNNNNNNNNSNENSESQYNVIESNPTWIGFSQHERNLFLKWGAFKLKKNWNNKGHFLISESGRKLKYEFIKSEISNYCRKFKINTHGKNVNNNNSNGNNGNINYNNGKKHSDYNYIDSKISKYKKHKYVKYDWETSWKQFITIEQFGEWNMLNKYQRKMFLKWGDFYLENSHKHKNEHILMSAKGVPLTSNAINHAFNMYNINQKKKFFILNNNDKRYKDRERERERDRERERERDKNRIRERERDRDIIVKRKYDIRHNIRDPPRKKRRYSHQ